MLRAIEDNDALREHFELGVNFIESLVNRHRVEVYILDASGRIAVSFERIHWDEEKIVTCAVEMLKEKDMVAFKPNVSIDRCLPTPRLCTYRSHPTTMSALDLRVSSRAQTVCPLELLKHRTSAVYEFTL